MSTLREQQYSEILTNGHFFTFSMFICIRASSRRPPFNPLLPVVVAYVNHSRKRPEAVRLR